MMDKTLREYNYLDEAKVIKSVVLPKKILVSVSMITYNHEKYIEEAINGVLMQETDFEIELIISNDNSPDQTDAVIQRIMSEHPRGCWIKYIRNEINIGMMANVIENFQHARGEYIAICEGDDYWINPLKLQLQIDEMRRHPECDLSFHPAIIVSDSLRTKKVTAFHSIKNKIFTTTQIIKGGGSFCPTASLLFKKKVIESLPKFYCNAPVGDYYLQIFGSARGGAVYLNKVMAAYRVNNAASWSVGMNDVEKRKIFFEKFIYSLNELNIFLNGKYKKEIDSMVEKQYYEMSLFYLTGGYRENYKLLFNDYFKIYLSKFSKMRFFYYVGLSTSSPEIIKYFNKFFFDRPIFFIRIFNKILKIVCLKKILLDIERNQVV
ncbi:glycosyltransferase [Glaciimonas sp. PCH181]|uniref:glycosyltransferase family 2 protein n=1 Tax=Glaciimonas sp. PCH181 TaxID=2133943 RepID=UPI000D346810|nr:glycosyltransferase [Glaciimonas sp. PCH181]PUA16915.1 hypothetical protein C7W93_13085 [Glaciimonas sp. PCH181]